MNDMEVVSALNSALAEKVGAERFDLWFNGHTQLSVSGDDVLVKVRTPFLQDWLRKTFRREIESACEQTLRRAVSISFEVDPQLAEASAASAPCETRSESAPSDVSRSMSSVQRDLPTLKVANPEPPAAAEHSQRRRFATLDDFVVGAGNRMAHVSICDVVDGHGHANPLFVHGPTGVGKSHLLEGLWSAVRRRRSSAQTVFLSAEQFTSYFLGALHGTGLPNFRRKYRGLDLLIIDDVQFFAGKRATIVELLYTVDTLLRDHRQIVLAADRPLDQLGELGPELLARLEGGMVCSIESADYETRLSVVERLCRHLRIDAPADVQELVARNVTSHARALAGALKRLRAASLAKGCPITTALAATTLTELTGVPAREVRLSDIEAATCSVFGIEPSTLRSGGAKRVAYPRMLAMWLARKHTRAALSEIGTYFGRRSHSTVISAQKKIEALLIGPQQAGQLSTDDAIRRVEEALRVG